MVHEHLMSVMNAVSIFDEYGHHENKSERINRLLSVLTGMEGSYENGGKETKWRWEESGVSKIAGLRK